MSREHWLERAAKCQWGLKASSARVEAIADALQAAYAEGVVCAIRIAIAMASDTERPVDLRLGAAIVGTEIRSLIEPERTNGGTRR
jgi:hypothetical protein